MGGRALLQVSCLLQLDIILEEIEASTSFAPFKEIILNSKNARGIYQTLRFLLYVSIFTLGTKYN